MMNFMEEKYNCPIFFKEYTGLEVILNIGKFTNSIILNRENILSNNLTINKIENLNENHINLLMENCPEVIIIGTGKKQKLPTQEIFTLFAMKGISPNFMSSDTACKTFNLLANENRNVSCLLII